MFSSNKNKLAICIVTKQLPNRKSDVEDDSICLPEFWKLVNYPDHFNRTRPTVDLDGSLAAFGKRRCVMCGCLYPISFSYDGNQHHSTTNDIHTPLIPRQNKGVCTSCDVTVWVWLGDIPKEPRSLDGFDDDYHNHNTNNESSGIEIKWCKGCKNFRPWVSFGMKGSATKCLRCRLRQKEKYQLKKTNGSMPLPQAMGPQEPQSHQPPACDNMTQLLSTGSMGEEDKLAVKGLRHLMQASLQNM
jgi:hypothetical protein